MDKEIIKKIWNRARWYNICNNVNDRDWETKFFDEIVFIYTDKLIREIEKRLDQEGGYAPGIFDDFKEQGNIEV